LKKKHDLLGKPGLFSGPATGGFRQWHFQFSHCGVAPEPTRRPREFFEWDQSIFCPAGRQKTPHGGYSMFEGPSSSRRGCQEETDILLELRELGRKVHKRLHVLRRKVFPEALTCSVLRLPRSVLSRLERQHSARNLSCAELWPYMLASPRTPLSAGRSP